SLRAGVEVNYKIFGAKGSLPPLPIAAPHEVVAYWGTKEVVLNYRQFAAKINACDVVLDISEGDSFSDIYGLKRFLMHFVPKAIVQLHNRPLVLSPQTIGPFENMFCRQFACLVMRHCNKVFARDGQSMNYLHELGVSKNAQESIDVAFRLPYQPSDQPSQSGKMRIGINVSALMYNGGYNRSNQFGLKLDYKSFTHDLLDELTRRDDCEVHLVPHVVPSHLPIEDDYALGVQLATCYSGVILPERFTDPSVAKSYISGLDFFIGARMHACIAAFSSGVPVIPIAYSRKFSGLFSSLGYNYVGECRTSGAQELMTLIRDGIANREQIKGYVQEGNLIADKRLICYEDFLCQRFIELGH
ncbi:MAG: polysaccharide pyruvyl transferase family protein, partial [Desulfobulbaceae bacterium]|nr:polysaccharide pyruvyl transferase family protein [Desulfobulbaceae bacterium]